MKQKPLTGKDKSLILTEVKSTIRFSLIYIAIILGLILLMVAILFLFFDEHPVEGFFSRFLNLLWKVMLVLTLLSYKQLLMLADLLRNRKVVFEISLAKVENTKKGKVLKIPPPVRQNLDIPDELMSILKQDQPLKVEAVKWSKCLLSVSQDKLNLLEWIDKRREEIMSNHENSINGS